MLSRLARLLALAALFASVICTVEASSHSFSDPPPTQKEANASAVAARPPLPKCSSAASKCVLTTPAGGSGSGGDRAGGDSGSWPALDASYAGTQWLAPPKIPSTIRASDSYYQIAKLPLSRSACFPGSEVEARLVLRFPEFQATKSKTDAMAEQRNTAGIMVTSNPLASDKQSGKTRRCVLAGVRQNASAAEAAAGAREAEGRGAASTTSEAKCTECNSLVTTSGNYVRCPSVPGVWYVDRLPLRIPAAATGWCDDGGGDDGGGGNGGKGSSEETRRAQPPIESEKTPGDYASFVVNAGSEVEVALFDVVGRSSGPEAPSA